MKRIALLLLVAAVAVGCSKKENSTVSTSSTATEAATTSPEDLGRLGAQLKKNPAEATRILSERGFDEQTFAEAIRKVTEDKDSSRRYAEAFKQEEGS